MAQTYGQSPSQPPIPTLIGFNTNGHLMDFAVTKAQTLGLPKLVLGSVTPITDGLAYTDRGRACAALNGRPVTGYALLRDGDVLTYRTGPEEDSAMILKLALTHRKAPISWSKLPLGPGLSFLSVNETLKDLRISNFREAYSQYYFRRTPEGYSFKSNDNTLPTAVDGVFLPGEVALPASSLVRAGEIWYYYTGRLLWIGSPLPITLRSGKAPVEDDRDDMPDLGSRFSPVMTDTPDLGKRSAPVLADISNLGEKSMPVIKDISEPVKTSSQVPASATPKPVPIAGAASVSPTAGQTPATAQIPESSAPSAKESAPAATHVPAPSTPETASVAAPEPVLSAKEPMPAAAPEPGPSTKEPAPAQTPESELSAKESAPAATPEPAPSAKEPTPTQVTKPKAAPAAPPAQAGTFPAKPQINTTSAFKDARLVVDIRARRVRKGLRMRTLLEDIRLSVDPGDFVLILGGSGAGKSTFIKSVMGYDRADGKIRYGDLDVYRDYEKVKYEIGYVPQQNLVRMNDTVYHTLMSEARMKMPGDTPPAVYARQCEWAMGLLGLEAEKNNMCSSISGGQLKRLSIAIELVGDPGLFFLDEPDSGLDGTMSRKLMENLRTIADLGKIVMVITHGPDRAADLFNKVLVLGKTSDNVGHLLFYGGVSEAKAFFGTDSLEHIVRRINSREEGGEGLADHFLEKYRTLEGGGA